MRVIIFCLLFISTKIMAQTNAELERINFFPRTNAYASLEYQYQIINIEAPKAAVNDKEVINFTNSLQFIYAHALRKNLFLGVKGSYERASENAVEYGIGVQERFNSSGPRDPEFFLVWRIKEQKDENGLVDFFFSFADEMGAREVGHEDANRLSGRNQLRLGLSHGFLEDRWEFKSEFEFHYLDNGKEHNKILSQSYDLRSSYDFKFKFYTQYRLQETLFAYGSIGVLYRDNQEIRSGGESYREIQSGTGSIFEVGLKKNLNHLSLIQFTSQIQRNEYFVKGTASNLDGVKITQTFALNIIRGF